MIYNKWLSFSDAAESWQLGLQDPATPTVEGMIFFHDYLLFFIISIAVFVFWMLCKVIIDFDSNKQLIVNKFTHSSLLEVVWTIIPAFLLVLIAVPSFALLYSLDELIDPEITVKIVGHQWYWSYEYSDFEPVSSSPSTPKYELPDLSAIKLPIVLPPIVLPPITFPECSCEDSLSAVAKAALAKSAIIKDEELVKALLAKALTPTSENDQVSLDDEKCKQSLVTTFPKTSEDKELAFDLETPRDLNKEDVAAPVSEIKNELDTKESTPLSMNEQVMFDHENCKEAVETTTNILKTEKEQEPASNSEIHEDLNKEDVAAPVSEIKNELDTKESTPLSMNEQVMFDHENCKEAVETTNITKTEKEQEPASNSEIHEDLNKEDVAAPVSEIKNELDTKESTPLSINEQVMSDHENCKKAVETTNMLKTEKELEPASNSEIHEDLTKVDIKYNPEIKIELASRKDFITLIVEQVLSYALKKFQKAVEAKKMLKTEKEQQPASDSEIHEDLNEVEIEPISEIKNEFDKKSLPTSKKD